jgi:putative addiction module component (TIGR02574 family)
LKAWQKIAELLVARATAQAIMIHMTENETEAVIEQALRLDPAHRLELATRLLDSVEEPESEEWTAAWTAELDRRSAAMESGADAGVTTVDVMARARAKLGR